MIKKQHLTPKAALEIEALQAEEQRDAQAAALTGDPAALFLLRADDRELAGVNEILQSDGDKAANAIVEELILLAIEFLPLTWRIRMSLITRTLCC